MACAPCFKPTFAAGLFAGSLTNIPALAAALEQFKAAQGGRFEQTLAEPVVACSLAYPVGVGGMILALVIARFLTAKKKSAGAQDSAATDLQIIDRTVQVMRTMPQGATWNPCGGRGLAPFVWAASQGWTGDPRGRKSRARPRGSSEFDRFSAGSG